MAFSNKDKEIMNLALAEAKLTGSKGNFPIAAALAINGDLVDLGKNLLHTEGNWYSHAENTLIQKNSKLILEEKKKGSLVELFSTLEPCFMCFGTSLLHRIPRVVFACPDPYGGVASLNKGNFPVFYRNRWPQVEGGLLAKESYGLMMDFLRSKNTPEFKEILEVYERMKV